MTVVKKEKIRAKNGVLHITLPDEFKDKTVDRYYKNRYKKWKFNREEIYG